MFRDQPMAHAFVGVTTAWSRVSLATWIVLVAEGIRICLTPHSWFKRFGLNVSAGEEEGVRSG